MAGTPRVLIGITGRLASGKGRMTAEILKRYSAEYVKFSDSMRNVLDIYDISQSRDHIDALSTFLRKAYGEDVLARAVEKKALSSEYEIVVIDGVRRKVDFERLGKHSHFILVYIDVKPETRYERSKQRNENVGDADLTYEEFLSDDSGEPQQQIDSLKGLAHYVIDNNGTVEEFDRQIDEVLKKTLA